MSDEPNDEISGIYQIRNIHTGRTYIGKSRNIHDRWLAHRHALDRGVHVNDDLQGDWEIYGAHAFEFTVLEEVTGHKALCNAEARHIAVVSSPYNIVYPQTNRVRLVEDIVDAQSFTPLDFLKLIYHRKPSAVASAIYASYGIVESTIGALLFKTVEQGLTDCTQADFAIFEDFGYKGLYNGETARDIAARKGIASGQRILDYMSDEELAANWFRAVQTEAKIRREEIDNKQDANAAHYVVGKKVRETIADLGGTMPEDLSTPEQSIQQLERAEQQRIEAERRPTLFPSSADQ